MKSYQCVTGTLHSGPCSMAEVLGLLQLAENQEKEVNEVLLSWGWIPIHVWFSEVVGTHARKLHGVVLLISITWLQFNKQLCSVNTSIVIYFKKLEMHL